MHSVAAWGARAGGDAQAAIDAAKKAVGNSGLDIESFLIMPVRGATNGHKGALTVWVGTRRRVALALSAGGFVSV